MFVDPAPKLGDSDNILLFKIAQLLQAAGVGGGGVLSFNTRTGDVVLTSADVGAVGVSSFNTRIGNVVLTAGDVAAVGVSSFNTRIGPVALVAADVESVVTLGRGSDPYFRQVGTSPVERWYGNSPVTSSLMGALAPVVGQLYAAPYLSGRGGTLDRIAFNVTIVGAAGSVARVGIYTATSDTNLYPNALVLDGGEFVATSTGMKTANITQALLPNSLYWLVFLCGVAAPTVRAGSSSGTRPFLGMDNALGTAQAHGFTVAQAYGALPATFPAGGAVLQGSGIFPIVGVRYSA